MKRSNESLAIWAILAVGLLVSVGGIRFLIVSSQREETKWMSVAAKFQPVVDEAISLLRKDTNFFELVAHENVKKGDTRVFGSVIIVDRDSATIHRKLQESMPSFLVPGSIDSVRTILVVMHREEPTGKVIVGLGGHELKSGRYSVWFVRWPNRAVVGYYTFAGFPKQFQEWLREGG